MKLGIFEYAPSNLSILHKYQLQYYTFSPKKIGPNKNAKKKCFFLS